MSKPASPWTIPVIAMSMIVLSVSALSLELEQAKENCHASIGRPTYLACEDKGGSHESCMAHAKEAATPCVRSAMTAARPKADLANSTG